MLRISRRLAQPCSAASLLRGLLESIEVPSANFACESLMPGLVQGCGLQWCSIVRSWRSFQTSAASQKALEVKIQSMGESISEGTVAAILKQPGDRVEEDEPILQIETDKVTIDVRAPEAGKLENLLVKADDTVTTGQLVATVASGEEGSQSGQSAKEAKPEEPKQGQSKQAPEAQQASAPSQQQQQPTEQPGQQQHRQPGIRFPRRRLPDGTRISDLPFDEQQQHSKAPPKQQQQQPSQSQSRSSKPDPPPQRKHVVWYVGKEQGTKLSQSRVLSDREMEQIELGGA